MLEKDRRRLFKDYARPLPGDSDVERLSRALDLDLANAAALGVEIVGDLDAEFHGIGWWRTYTDIDVKTRILLSDYLVACARAVVDNVLEARIERFEFDDAVEEFRKWTERGVKPGKPLAVPPPRSAFQEISTRRVHTHLAGILRAWGSALDCLGGCIVGVTGLPAELVRADLNRTMDLLEKQALRDTRLTNLRDALKAAEAQAGPAGWRAWLLNIRHTFVHRGRHTLTFALDVDRAGLHGFFVKLPIYPEGTEIEAIIRAEGLVASTFSAPAGPFLDELGQTVGAYISEVTRVLTELWRERRAQPAVLAQSPRQWKATAGVINPAPVFQGFPSLPGDQSPVADLNVGTELHLRFQAAGVTQRGASEVRVDPKVWS